MLSYVRSHLGSSTFDNTGGGRSAWANIIRKSFSSQFYCAALRLPFFHQTAHSARVPQQWLRTSPGQSRAPSPPHTGPANAGTVGEPTQPCAHSVVDAGRGWRPKGNLPSRAEAKGPRAEAPKVIKCRMLLMRSAAWPTRHTLA